MMNYLTVSLEVTLQLTERSVKKGKSRVSGFIGEKTFLLLQTGINFL